MSRKPRIHAPGTLYHIFSRGNNKQNIFLTENDYERFVLLLKTVKERTKFLLHAYCLMPNHFHLLVEVKNHTISDITQRLLTAYTKYFNRIHNKTGHLFQGRYKAILCDKDSYLLELIRYIHLNPVRAKITESPNQWQWSGHYEYFSSKKVIF